MSPPGFVHLRLHSEYSIVDGMVRLDDAVGRRKAFEKHMAAAADIPSVKDDPLD